MFVPGLAQPHWITNFGLETDIIERLHGSRYLVGRKKDVQILGIAPDTGVLVKGKCP